MLPPLIRTTVDTAAGAAPDSTGGPPPAAADGVFSLFLGAAGADAAGGTALPPAGNGLPLPPGTALAAPRVTLPTDTDVTLPLMEAAAPPEPAAPPVADTGAGELELAALELMLPGAAAPVATAAPAAAAAGQAAPAAVAAPEVIAAARSVPGAAVTAPASRPGELPGLVAAMALPPAAAAETAAVPGTPAGAVQIRDAAGRNEFALADLLGQTARRERTAPAPAADAAFLRVDAGNRTAAEALPLTSFALPTTGTPAAAVATSTPAPPAIPLPVGAADWGDALAERVVVMAGQKLSSADIRLNPAELGPLRVEIRIEDGAAQVSFQAQHAVTRDAIEQALPRLRELFANEGLALTGTSVGEQGLREDRGGAAGQAADAVANQSADDGDDAADVEPLAAARAAIGLVDTFA